jgi:translation initiation factor 2 subunit 1
MLLKKKGFPEENELLLCTVTKIFGHSVFVNIEDYNKQGMIHISEVSPGRIRNLRDYVVEGKKIVCVVLRINMEKGHIDLSLRRVNDGQRRKKLEQIKLEQKSEKIIEQVAKELHKEKKQFVELISEKILSKYSKLHLCFGDVVKDEVNLIDLGVEKDTSEKLTAIIKERMKPPKAILFGNFSIKVFNEEGIEIIKTVLKKAQDIKKGDIVIKYAGGGFYNISVTAKDFKECEKILKKVVDSTVKLIEQKKGTIVFQKIEK